MSKRRLQSMAGAAFIAAFLLYGGGQYLLDEGYIAAGLALILINSVVVSVIGVLLRSIIAATAPGIAQVYMGARLLEGALLAAGAIAFVVLDDDSGIRYNEFAYRTGMIVLSVGGVLFCHWLLRRRRVPIILAAWGVVGYLALGAAMVLDPSGQSVLGMWLLLPGGVFELFFGIWLMARPLEQQADG